jgi:preprotein translocase subunit SecE
MANSPAGKSKRLVKSPETFRERASKAVEASDQPQKRHLILGALGRVFGPPARLLERLGRRIARIRVLRPFGKLLKLIGRIVFPRYFRNSWRELKLVTWPTWKESRQLTYAVLVFAIIFGAAIALVDFGLDKAFRSILLK